MDYSKIYIELIERSFDRELDCYTEKHHVIPRCLGGDDKERNIAVLTPEEHYICHQLLVKIFPDNEKLVYAANMMCVGRSNKRYGWLKRKFSKTQRGKFVSDETRQRISESKKGSVGTFIGKTHTQETRKKLSDINTGKIMSKEVRQKRSSTSKKVLKLPEV